MAGIFFSKNSFSLSRLAVRNRWHASYQSRFFRSMCNLYSITRSQEAIRRAFRVMRDRTGTTKPSRHLSRYNGAGCPHGPRPARCCRRRARIDDDALGLPAAAKPRHGAGHQCPQSQVALLARMAQGRVALSCSGNLILRMDRHAAQGARPPEFIVLNVTVWPPVPVTCRQ